MSPDQYVSRVLQVLGGNPTAADLDFLVQAHATIGFYASEAESEAERLEAERKYSRVNIILEAKRSDPKATGVWLDALADKGTYPEQVAENVAKANFRKLRNLLESVEQAINAVKFLGRNDTVRFGGS